jgi:hypothetical protein
MTNEKMLNKGRKKEKIVPAAPWGANISPVASKRLVEIRKEIISTRGKLKRARTPNKTKEYMNDLIKLEEERDFLSS